jgi:hypothetical protein
MVADALSTALYVDVRAQRAVARSLPGRSRAGHSARRIAPPACRVILLPRARNARAGRWARLQLLPIAGGTMLNKNFRSDDAVGRQGGAGRLRTDIFNSRVAGSQMIRTAKKQDGVYRRKMS